MPQGMSIKKAPAKKAQGSIAFGYWTSGFGAVGTSTAETFDCAIYVPSTYAGKQITAFSFYLYDASILTDVKGWVSASLPSNVDNADFVQNVTSPLTYSSGDNVITLDTPVTIPSEGCYVGYSFTVTSVSSNAGKYPVLTSTDDDVDGGMYLRTSQSMTSWSNMYGQGFGNLCITVAISGEFADNAASVEDFGNAYAGKGVEGTASVTLTSTGTNEITSVGYTITDVSTGSVSSEATYNLSSAISLGASTTINLPIVGEATTGSTEKLITITKVNGVDNEETANVTSEGTLITLSRIVNRKVVEEEYTATGCGWCPRGIVGMEQLEANRSDNWIGIAVHCVGVSYYDPMYVSDYYDILNTVSGYPSAQINRGAFIDPYYGSSSSTSLGIFDDVDAAASVPSVADIDVRAYWSSEEMTIINVDADVTFLYNSDTDNYGLAYVLLADGLSGTSTYWKQANYFRSYASYYADDEYLYPWTQKSSSVSGMEYNHVALAAQGIVNGVDGSISLPIVEEEKQSHSTTFDVSSGITSATTGDALLQDKSKLKVVAMLIDKSTGEIINAEECSVPGYTTGISSVSASDENAAEVARYTIDGTKVNAPVKGLNIVKLSNGKSVKVVVK